MPAPNKYLDGLIGDFYRREVMHVMIFTFIDAFTLAYPSITIQEAAGAFMKRYKVDEDLYSINTVVNVYGRVCQDLINAQRKAK